MSCAVHCRLAWHTKSLDSKSKTCKAAARLHTWTRGAKVILKGRSCGKLRKSGGAVAQLGARLDGIEEVVGSNPIGSTKNSSNFKFLMAFSNGKALILSIV